MTKILVVSDSHGALGNVVKLLARETGNFDVLVHLGDGIKDFKGVLREIKASCHFIKGNVDLDLSPDISSQVQQDSLINIEQIPIYLSHGDMYKVKSGLKDLKKQVKKIGARIALFGHTHIPFKYIEKGILYFNPGSLKDGFYGMIGADDNRVVYFDHRSL